MIRGCNTIGMFICSNLPQEQGEQGEDGEHEEHEEQEGQEEQEEPCLQPKQRR
jgi:hypothetical protein